MTVNIIENIRRIGVFMIAAQTVMHFAAGRQYEKYMKIVTGIIVLLMFIGPFASSFENPMNDWQAEIELLEQQIQGNMQREMLYVESAMESTALRQIEEEIKKRLNNTIPEQNCIVTDVVIDLEETGVNINAEASDEERNYSFRCVKVTLQDVAEADDHDGNEDRTIRIDEITVGSGAETGAEQQKMQESERDAILREYQQLFAQTLGVTDDRVEVTYHGEW